MTLFIFLMACYGVVNIVTAGKIFEGLRKFLDQHSKIAGYWIKCPMCLGVPVGIGWALLGLSPGTGLGLMRDAAIAGALSSGWCWVLRVLMHRLGEDDL